ncbi:MAG: preprotein translocase subunit YajC [Firmicutes bacterium]|nr:preprotein translocase subunit YajC [Bacillota bacterium]MBQ4092112.1 preprotein translocase subunit YajC [Bacillota bacterium]
MGSIVWTVLYIAAIIAIIYLLIIRPQKKRQKEHDNLVNALSLGVEIVTIGGIHGEVSRIKDETIWIKVSNNVEIEIEKSSVARTIS